MVGQPGQPECRECLARDGDAADHCQRRGHKNKDVEDQAEARRGCLMGKNAGERGDNPIPTAIDVHHGNHPEADAQSLVPEDTRRPWLGRPDEQVNENHIDDARGDGAFA